MFIEAFISLKGALYRVSWTDRGDGQPQLGGAPIAVETLLVAEQVHRGQPIGIPGYPPSYRDALGDPMGFLALCYVVSERIPHFTVLEQEMC